MNEDGYREMTPEEEAMLLTDEQEEQIQQAEPLTQMVEDMAAATTIAQLRAAAKKFLISTE